MNSVQLAHRVCRRLKVKDPSLLAGNDLLEVVDAMNAAITEYWSLLPSRLKNTTFSGYQPAPRTVSLSVTEGSESFSVVSGSVTTEDIGRTVRVGTDTADNEIVGVTEFLDVYTGPSGTVSATIYSDAIQIGLSLERITSEPRVIETEEVLQYWDRRDNDRYRHPDFRTIGSPLWYWTEDVGMAAGATIAQYLRVDPMPSTAIRIRLDAIVAPVSLAVSSVLAPVSLPGPDRHFAAILVPLALQRMLDSELWSEDSARSVTQQKAQSARMMLEMMPRKPDAAQGRIYTPAGW